MMLPPDFDSSKISSAKLKTVVETLKTYGAYVVDRNTGTPFVIYVENDSGFSLSKGWDNAIANQLDLIRAGLRQVTSAKGWVDGNGNALPDAMKTPQWKNILSMRGPWIKQSGTAAAAYDATTGSLLFDASTTKTVQMNASNAGMTPVKWAIPKEGDEMKFTVAATGGATLRLQVKSNGLVKYESQDLTHGQSARLEWPANATVTLIATSGMKGASSVKAALMQSH